MKYYSQYLSHDLFELQDSLSGLSKSNRWVKLADNLPWDKIEKEYNKRLRNRHNGAGNKPARMIVGAFIVKHVENLSDEKTIQSIQENPYMQYLLGLPKFTEKPVFVPELFVLVRKRLDHDFFNMLTLMLAEADGSKPKKEHIDEEGNDHGGTMKIDATCSDAEVRYPTDCNLLEDGSNLIDRLLNKFCARYKIMKSRTHRAESRQAFIRQTKKKRKGKKLVDKTKLVQIRCLQADFQTFFDLFGAKIGASIVNGYTYVDRLSWDAYNESSDLVTQMELYRMRFGILPQEVQADKLYLGKENRKYIKACHVNCYNRPLGRPPKEENDLHADDKKRAIGERNEIEATFGTSKKKVYRANDIRAKLDDTADTWIGACFFAKNAMKFLRGLLCLFFANNGLKTIKRRIFYGIDNLVGVLTSTRECLVKII